MQYPSKNGMLLRGEEVAQGIIIISLLSQQQYVLGTGKGPKLRGFDAMWIGWKRMHMLRHPQSRTLEDKQVFSLLHNYYITNGHHDLLKHMRFCFV